MREPRSKSSKRKQPEIIRYYHAAAGFPTKSTWLQAINNKHFASWPGLTAEKLNKYFPESDEVLKGHSRKYKSGLRSTKQQPQDTETQPKENLGHNDVFLSVCDVTDNKR